MPSSVDTREAYVYMHLPGHGHVPAGLLTYYRNSDSARFGYAESYLERPDCIPLDPVTMPLSLGPGSENTVDTPRGFGVHNVFKDVSPDKWGRKVILFMAGRGASGELDSFDLATGLHYPGRIGALAFGPDPVNGPASLASWARGAGHDPFLKSIADLHVLVEFMKFIMERVDEDEDGDMDKIREVLPDDALIQALACSLSVGGGRPKLLYDSEGASWIVKFPKPGDSWNEPRIEYAAMSLAGKCGINVPRIEMRTIGGMDLFLIERFDRDRSRPRHMISAFTLRDLAEDGDWGSYQKLAEAARRHGDERAGPELFRRMLFNLMVYNRDDHPKNHSFFVEQQQVRLTPAYDMVPEFLLIADRLMALALGKQGRTPTIENALSDVYPFGLKPKEAKDISEEMISVFKNWESFFLEHKVDPREVEMLRKRIYVPQR